MTGVKTGPDLPASGRKDVRPENRGQTYPGGRGLWPGKGRIRSPNLGLGGKIWGSKGPPEVFALWENPISPVARGYRRGKRRAKCCPHRGGTFWVSVGNNPGDAGERANPFWGFVGLPKLMGGWPCEKKCAPPGGEDVYEKKSGKKNLFRGL